MAQACHNTKDDLTRDATRWIQIPHNGSQTGLIEVVPRGVGDKSDKILKRVGQQPTLIGGRSQVLDSGLDASQAGLGRQFGSCINGEQAKYLACT
jgi:hypothetical protein